MTAVIKQEGNRLNTIGHLGSHIRNVLFRFGPALSLYLFFGTIILFLSLSFYFIGLSILLFVFQRHFFLVTFTDHNEFTWKCFGSERSILWGKNPLCNNSCSWRREESEHVREIALQTKISEDRGRGADPGAGAETGLQPMEVWGEQDPTPEQVEAQRGL